MKPETTTAPEVVVEQTTGAATELAASKVPNQSELDGVNAKLAAATAWTPEENTCIDGLQSKLGITRREAIARLTSGKKKGHSPDRVLAEAIAPKPAATPKPAAKATRPKQETKAKSKGEAKVARQGKYSKDAIIKAWERGNRPSEIAEMQTAGIKGVSKVYVSRVLFGTTYEGGQTPEQEARLKVEKTRRADRTAENAAE